MMSCPGKERVLLWCTVEGVISVFEKAGAVHARVPLLRAISEERHEKYPLDDRENRMTRSEGK